MKTLLELIPQTADRKARKWEQRIASEVRRRVWKERAISFNVQRLNRFSLERHFWRGREHYAVAIIADMAGVQWFYNPNTGEVRFFEFQ